MIVNLKISIESYRIVYGPMESHGVLKNSEEAYKSPWILKKSLGGTQQNLNDSSNILCRPIEAVQIH